MGKLALKLSDKPAAHNGVVRAVAVTLVDYGSALFDNLITVLSGNHLPQPG